MERLKWVHFYLTLAIMVALCATGISLNVMMDDVHKLSLQVGDNKTEILKLHLDVLTAVAAAQKAKGAAPTTPPTP